jgi:hypothetical protein
MDRRYSKSGRKLKKHYRSVYIYENTGIFNWKVNLYQALSILQRSL